MNQPMISIGIELLLVTFTPVLPRDFQNWDWSVLHLFNTSDCPLYQWRLLHVCSQKRIRDAAGIIFYICSCISITFISLLIAMRPFHINDPRK